MTKKVPGHWGQPIKKGPCGCSSKLFHSPSSLHEGDPWGVLPLIGDWKLFEKVINGMNQIHAGVWPKKLWGTVIFLTARMFPH